MPPPKDRRSQGNSVHEKFIRQAIEIAANTRNNGGYPFSAILVDPSGRVMITAENTVATTHDGTRHAELNAIQLAAAKFSAEGISRATLYASTEPCVMCSGAIHWAGIRTVVFGCSAKTLAAVSKSDDFLFSCRETLSRTRQPSVVVIGPVLESEAVAVHKTA